VAARAISSPYAQLPNALTIVRLLLIPVFVVVMLGAEEGRSVAAFAVFAVAGTTDQIDGWLARRWRVESAFGRVADPLADRLLIDSAVVLLYLQDRLPLTGLAAILARDLVLVGGYRFVVPRGYELSVSTLGKVATWVLYASLGFMLLTRAETSWPLWLFWLGLVLAVLAAAIYVVSAVRQAAS
jgi:CDP-diacylglycerol--glycerol-3-phosphate 3-phosphatidyltransferase